MMGVRGAFTGVDWLGWGGVGGCSGIDAYCPQGALFHPTLGTWTAVATAGAPAGRDQHGVAAIPGGVLVWGGRGTDLASRNDGAIYDPGSDSWTPVLSQGAPTSRYAAFSFATKTEVVIWGGVHSSDGKSASMASDGAAYDFTTRTWRPLSTAGAPSPRSAEAIVATGADILVWSGIADDGNPLGSNVLADGGVYHLATDTWEPISSVGAPPARMNPVTLWTGSEMLVFGGMGCGGRQNGIFVVCQDAGFAYNPATRRWRTITAGLAPRSGAIAAWTGSRAFIWGGIGSCCAGYDCRCTDGGLYDPASDSWQAVVPDGSPIGDGTAYWIGDSVLVISNLGPPGRYFPPSK